MLTRPLLVREVDRFAIKVATNGIVDCHDIVHLGKDTVCNALFRGLC